MRLKHAFSLPRRDYEGTGKRVFIGLVVGTAVLLCALILLIWLVPTVGFAGIHPWLPSFASLFFGLAIAVVVWIAVGLVVQAFTGTELWGMGLCRGLSVRCLLPLMELVGSCVGIPREKVRRSFIKVNNEAVMSLGRTYAPKDVLILLPHCIQASACKHRLTQSIEQCQRCGACPIHTLRDLQERFGVVMAIATGGTLARRIVVTLRPKLIIAIACERDLTSGIQDTYPLPVFGVINSRPHGPCFDTQVDNARLKAALDVFVERPAASMKP